MNTTESKELTVTERAVKALSSVANEKVLQDLVAQSATIVAIKNADGRTQCHSAYMALKNRRTAITAVGKESREDATKFSQAVIAEEKRLIAITEPEETRLKTLRDAWDAEVEAARLAVIKAEAERVVGIRKMIDDLRATPVPFHDRPAADIQIAIDDLTAFDVTEEAFAELVNEAHSAKIDVIATLTTLHANALRRAEEAQKLADERAELARLRTEQEERDRVAAAERAEQDAKDRVAREAQEAADRETKRKADEAMAAERDAHERKMAAEREALRVQQDALNADRKRIADEAAERQRAIDAEFAAEQARILAQKNAEVAEQARRERQDFVNNGPDASDIITIIANAYVVDSAIALNWLNMHAWDQVEVLA